MKLIITGGVIFIEGVYHDNSRVVQHSFLLTDK